MLFRVQSGRKTVRFSFADHDEGQLLQVSEVLDQWYGTEYRCFKVLASDGTCTFCAIRSG